MTDFFQKMLANPEELDPELAECLVDYGEFTAIKHPLVHDAIYMKAMNPKYNACLRMKREQIEIAKKVDDWGQVVFLHEKPWRVDALILYSDVMSDSDYWKLVREVWLNSENIHEWGDNIESILLVDRPKREFLMSAEDRAVYDRLDGRVVIFRGHQEENRDGWSWTLDARKAKWFARRYAADQPLITTAEVNKFDIIATFVGMGEAEVVVDPSKVNTIETVSLD